MQAAVVTHFLIVVVLFIHNLFLRIRIRRLLERLFPGPDSQKAMKAQAPFLGEQAFMALF